MAISEVTRADAVCDRHWDATATAHLHLFSIPSPASHWRQRSHAIVQSVCNLTEAQKQDRPTGGLKPWQLPRLLTMCAMPAEQDVDQTQRLAYHFELCSSFQFCPDGGVPESTLGGQQVDPRETMSCVYCPSTMDTIKSRPTKSAWVGDLEALCRKVYGEADHDAGGAIVLGRLMAEALACPDDAPGMTTRPAPGSHPDSLTRTGDRHVH